MSTTSQSETPETPPAPVKQTNSKYGPLLLIAAIIACVVGFRLYKGRDTPLEPVIAKIGVTGDGNAITMPTGLFRVKQIDLAYLKVPASASFRARFYIIDIVDDREVMLEMVDDESSCVLIVPEGNINYALVRYGLAQADGEPYQKAEDRAKKENLGLWNTQSEKVE